MANLRPSGEGGLPSAEGCTGCVFLSVWQGLERPIAQHLGHSVRKGLRCHGYIENEMHCTKRVPKENGNPHLPPELLQIRGAGDGPCTAPDDSNGRKRKLEEGPVEL